MRERLESAVWHLRSEARTQVGRSRHALQFLGRARGTPESIVNDATEIVIEGYPRSGNTFAVAAFTLAQGRPVSIAHHFHLPAQITDGVRRGLPTIALLRNPKDAAASRLIRRKERGGASPTQLLRHYSVFYDAVAKHADRLTIAPFEIVTTDFGAITRDLNARFSTSFEHFEPTSDNVDRAFELVETLGLSDPANTTEGGVHESSVARPSDERAALKQEAIDALESAEARPALRAATELYERLLAQSTVVASSADE